MATARAVAFLTALRAETAAIAGTYEDQRQSRVDELSDQVVKIEMIAGEDVVFVERVFRRARLETFLDVEVDWEANFVEAACARTVDRYINGAP